MQLGKEGKLKLGSVRHFVLDECDKMLDKLGAYLGSQTPNPVGPACYTTPSQCHCSMLLGPCGCTGCKAHHTC